MRLSQFSALFLCLMLCFSGVGQAQDSIKLVPTISVESLDLLALELEDDSREVQGLAPRYAIPNLVEITTTSHGHWEKLDDEFAMWRLRVTCKNAISMNFGFERWLLPIDSSMSIYNVDGTHRIRPFTIDDYSDSGELWTPPVAGGDVIIEIRCPQNAVTLINEEIKLTSINAGYRGFHEAFGMQPLPGNVPSLSGGCNIDVACPESIGWENEIDCVGVISTGGSTFCTGFMVNNTSQDGTPYFMTADHCGITSGNAPSLVVFWNYENSFCRTPGSAASGGPGDGVLNQFSTGSVFRAGSGISDFTLVELNTPPSSAFGVSFCGWDASTAAPSSAVGIHHPSTDEKRISFENQAPTLSTNFVTVEDWDAGTTEPGSSGSPLFDQNHRVIGQLCCGTAACGNNLSDDYGRFSRSWDLGLSAWLDSAGTGQLFVDTLPAGGGGPVEQCSNGTDDDGDGLVDCNDPDCAPSPACGGGGGGGPANDLCGDAQAVGEGVFSFDNTGASLDGPTACDGNMDADVWFAYTASSSGTATIETCGTLGSLDDSVLIVYDGGTCPPNPTCLASNDDGCTSPNFSSTVDVPVIGGNTYLIQVGGWNGANGTSDLSISLGGGPAPVEDCTNGVDDDGDGLADCSDPDCAADPSCGGGGGGGGNDLCANAQAVGEGVFAYDNSSAALDGPIDCDGNMGTDVWFLYSPTASGTATITTCNAGGSLDDTVLMVYDGSACPTAGAACLSSADDNCSNTAGGSAFMAEVTVPVTAGNSYLVQVGGWNGATGTGDLSISLGGGPAPVEDCTNGVDDDGDGLADCADPDCATNPACGGGGGGNDECIGAIAMFDGPNFFDTTGLTNSADPVPTGCLNAFGGMNNDGWFTYTATSTGDATFNTCDPAGFDTDLAIYAGDCSALSLLGCDGDGSTLVGCQTFDSEVIVPVIAGESYVIRVGGFGATDAGLGTVTITVGAGPILEDCTNGVDDDGDGLADCADPDCAADPACGGGGGGGPANDLCLDASPVAEGVFAYDNTGAVLDGPTDCDANMSTDVWFLYTASASGTATIGTCDAAGSLDDSTLIVYDGNVGCPLPGDIGLACNDDSCANTAGGAAFMSEVSIPVTAGNSYLIQVGGWNGSEGTGDLTISLGGGPAPIENCTNGTDDDGDGLIDCADDDCLGDPSCGGGGTGPANDDCANAQSVGEGAFAYDNTNAILDGPVDCDGNMATDVWFLYTATASGTATVTTCDANGTLDDSVLIVYDGGACPTAGAACLTSADDTCSNTAGGSAFMAEVTVPVTAGNSYLIQVGGWNGATGSGDLNISLGGGPAPVEDCTNGIDDDGDSFIDCEDTDCDQDPACVPPPVENCTNGTDDDGDGLADCSDPDCSNDPSCITNGFSFIAQDATASYSPDTGVGSFTGTVSALEDSAAPGYPNDTQGFSFGLAHDATLLSANTFTPGAALAALNAGSGPDFLDINTYSDGLTSGCVYSFSNPGSVVLQLTSETDLGTIDYDTVPSGLIGNSAGTTTSLTWSNALGAPPVINIMVVNGQANPASLVNGSITLEAAVGGFVRGDVNDDGGINIADAVSLLAGLFTGGLLPCADAADANDDGSTNIADAVYVLANLFSGGPGMPAPSGPSCGPDPTSDPLDCASYNSCP